MLDTFETKTCWHPSVSKQELLRIDEKISDDNEKQQGNEIKKFCESEEILKDKLNKEELLDKSDKGWNIKVSDENKNEGNEYAI